MRSNTAKRRMLDGQPALGIIAASGSTLAAQALSLAGFDFVLVDNQHGAWEQNAAMDAFHKISLGPATPMTRVQQNDFYAIGRMLDRGALGIIVPMVNSRQEAEAAAYAMHYPPRGGRSVGAFGVEFYGAPDYGEWIEREGFLAVQIESKQAYENAEAILSVEGIDGCWIGPGDLAATMRLDLSTASGRARHEEAILRIRDVCLQVGKIPGIYGHDNPEYWIERGFLFVTGVSDLALVSAAGRDLVRRVKG